MAKENIYITTAYFNPNHNSIQLLIEAVEQGVDVNIMMPGKHIDKNVARLAGEEAFEKLLDGGVKLWYYRKTMLHSKIITVGGEVSCIGSANFNHRSMMKDDEVNLVMIDENLAVELNNHFQNDLENCEKIDEYRWNGRPQWRKSLEKLTNLIKQQI